MLGLHQMAHLLQMTDQTDSSQHFIQQIEQHDEVVNQSTHEQVDSLQNSSDEDDDEDDDEANFVIETNELFKKPVKGTEATTLDLLFMKANRWARETQGFEFVKEPTDENSGRFVCWCHQKPRKKADGTEQKCYRIDEGRSHAACSVRVNWKRKIRSASNEEYYMISFDESLEKAHTHNLLNVTTRPINVTAVLSKKMFADDFPEAAAYMADMMQYDPPSRFWLQRKIERKWKLTFDDELFRNMYRDYGKTFLIPDPVNDFDATQKWAIAQPDAKFDVAIDAATNQGISLFYMSNIMIANCIRDGEVLFMDTTFGTNRYRYHMVDLMARSQFGSSKSTKVSLVAVMLSRQQRAQDFEYFFDRVKEAVGPEAWQRIRTICSDGDKAISKAIRSRLPHAFHMRCVYHIRTNIADNYYDMLGDESRDAQVIDAFVKHVDSIIDCRDREEAKSLIEQLYNKWPSCQSYLSKNIFKRLDSFAFFSVIGEQLSWDTQSSQSVEIFHSLIKRPDTKYGLELSSKSTALQVMKCAQLIASRQHENAIKEDQHELQKLLNMPTGTALSFFHQCLSKYTNHASAFLDKHHKWMHLCQVASTSLDGSVFFVRTELPLRVFDVEAEMRTDPPTMIQVKRNINTSAWCQCGVPTNYLLPCVHVMTVNQFVSQQIIHPEQIGQRWLRSFMPPVIEQPAVDRRVPGLYPSSHEIVHDDVMPADDGSLDLLIDECLAINEWLPLYVKSQPHLAPRMLSSMQLMRKFMMIQSNGDRNTELRVVVVDEPARVVEAVIIETPTVTVPKAKEARKTSRGEQEYAEAKNSSRNTSSSHKNKSTDSNSTRKSKKRKTKD